ncbi:hypothetical protein PInf_007998 [Phytophthora infestans]|nr:hypothetical protein PInf_007998 [Phytophthora infestans]
MFKAFVQVTKLAGRPDIATQKDIDDIVEKMRKEYGLDLSQGANRLLLDEDGVMIPDQATWINFVSFVRPFIVFTKK